MCVRESWAPGAPRHTASSRRGLKMILYTNCWVRCYGGTSGSATCGLAFDTSIADLAASLRKKPIFGSAARSNNVTCRPWPVDTGGEDTGSEGYVWSGYQPLAGVRRQPRGRRSWVIAVSRLRDRMREDNGASPHNNSRFVPHYFEPEPPYESNLDPADLAAPCRSMCHCCRTFPIR